MKNDGFSELNLARLDVSPDVLYLDRNVDADTEELTIPVYSANAANSFSAECSVKVADIAATAAPTINGFLIFLFPSVCR